MQTLLTVCYDWLQSTPFYRDSVTNLLYDTSLAIHIYIAECTNTMLPSVTKVCRLDRAIVAMACPYPATIIPHASWLPRKKASNISPAATAHGAVQQPVHHNSATGASLPVSICNTLDKAIDRFIDPPERRPLVDPQRVLSGNFEHVVELPPTRCPLVLGSIPSCLAGRAGPDFLVAQCVKK